MANVHGAIFYDDSKAVATTYSDWPWYPFAPSWPPAYQITTTGTKMVLLNDESDELIGELRERIERLEALLLNQIEVNLELFKMLMEQIKS